MCRTFSCSEGYNLSGFKSLLPNPNLNVSPLAPGASHMDSKSNTLYPCAASSSSSLPPLPQSLPVCHISSPHIPKVCTDVWPSACLFPETWINKGLPTRRPVHREAGSINISYVQLSQTVRTVDCINWSLADSGRVGSNASPRVTHFPIDHRKCVNCFCDRIEWMCLLFLYQCQTDEDEPPQRLPQRSVTSIHWTSKKFRLGPYTVVCDCNEKHPAAWSVVSFN